MTLQRINLIFYTLLLIIPFFKAQDSISSNIKSSSEWISLCKGMEYCELDAPKKSIVGDSKISILKFDPQLFDHYMLSATQFDSVPRTVAQWADSFHLNVVINAGMYDLSRQLISRAYLKSGEHVNNPKFNPAYNAIIAFDPLDSSSASCFNIFDLKCTTWEHVNTNYNACAQGMRMIDCDGNPLSWDKKKQSCSMLICAKDKKNQIYFIFCRSPYTHNEMIQFMLDFPFKLTNAIYMEGGPETSFYVHVGDTLIQKVGSYVSNTYPNDDNNHFWPLPNVIGLKVKK